MATVKKREKWEIESDVRTLKEAQTISADRARLRAATQMAKQEMVALSKVVRKSGPKK